MVSFDDFVEPTLSSKLVDSLNSSISKGFNFNLTWILIGVFILVLFIFVIVLVYKLSLPSEFRMLLKKGNAFLKEKDLIGAKKVYVDMKKMSEERMKKRMFSESLKFYNQTMDLEKGA